MRGTVKHELQALGLTAAGLLAYVAGITVGEYDDAPGAALAGILLLLGALLLALSLLQRGA